MIPLRNTITALYAVQAVVLPAFPQRGGQNLHFRMTTPGTSQNPQVVLSLGALEVPGLYRFGEFQGPAAGGACTGMFCISRPAVGAALNVGQAVHHAGSATTGASVNFDDPGFEVLSPFQHGVAQGAGAKYPEMVAFLPGHVECESLVVVFPGAEERYEEQGDQEKQTGHHGIFHRAIVTRRGPGYHRGMPELYMIATPLGNMGDISQRARDILASVDLIACEDTRHSGIFLKAMGISRPLVSCHGHNEEKSATHLVNLLCEGKSVAYISDAGTPGVSDPGNILVAKAAEAGIRVVPVPGPSALAAIISVLGLGAKRIAFEGFLSPKSGRRKRQIAELLGACDVGIVYESPFRVIAFLEDLCAVDPLSRVVAGRELTKIHEEILRGSPAEVAAILSSRDSVKGEFVIAIQTSGDFTARMAESAGAKSPGLEKRKKYRDTVGDVREGD